MLHSCVESAFRSFYSSVYCKKTRIKFYDVYKKLLHELNLDHYIDLLRLASNIRNSYHNNGIYTLEDDVISWKNSTYYFHKGKNIELNICYTFTDILEMLERVVKSDTICHRRDITDTSSSYTRWRLSQRQLFYFWNLCLCLYCWYIFFRRYVLGANLLRTQFV